MAALDETVNYLDSLLKTSEFKDASLNGLQVEAVQDPRSSAVKNVAVAVDSGLSIIEKAVSLKSDLLIVHHGLFWGQSGAITGVLAKKISLLMNGRCSLYASHLPLDGHPEVGNAAELAKFLELQDVSGFFEYNGKEIGVKGRCTSSKSIEYFTSRCAEMPGAVPPKVFAFGPDVINTVGIVTGSGASALKAFADAKLDLLVSGEPKHEVYHLAKELKVNAVFAGHYATETFGVLALGRVLKEKYNVTVNFIDESSGI